MVHNCLAGGSTSSAWPSRPGLSASWEGSPSPLEGWAYLRVDALYLLTELGGRLGIKFAAQLAMTEISPRTEADDLSHGVLAWEVALVNEVQSGTGYPSLMAHGSVCPGGFLTKACSNAVPTSPS